MPICSSVYMCVEYFSVKKFQLTLAFMLACAFLFFLACLLRFYLRVQSLSRLSEEEVAARDVLDGVLGEEEHEHDGEEEKIESKPADGHAHIQNNPSTHARVSNSHTHKPGLCARIRMLIDSNEFVDFKSIIHSFIQLAKCHLHLHNVPVLTLIPFSFSVICMFDW
jgi:hypothetical protein